MVPAAGEPVAAKPCKGVGMVACAGGAWLARRIEVRAPLAFSCCTSDSAASRGSRSPMRRFFSATERTTAATGRPWPRARVAARRASPAGVASAAPTTITSYSS